MVPFIEWTPIHNKSLTYALFYCSVLELPELLTNHLIRDTTSTPQIFASGDTSTAQYILLTYNAWVERMQENYYGLSLEDMHRWYKYWFFHSNADSLHDLSYVPVNNSPMLALPETFYPMYETFTTLHKIKRVNFETANLKLKILCPNK